VAQGEGPEFKPQHHKKKKKDNLKLMFYMYFLKWTYLFQFVRVTQQIVELILASTGIRPDFSV
jgi:hypothetical protein